jgi:glutaminase
MGPSRTARSTCPVQGVLNDVFKHLRADRSGAVATYIPELSKANPEWFAACLVTADGKIYEVGDTQQPFTIQSISKPFVYGMAIEDNGRAEVLKKVWVEPSGEAFNAISLRPEQGQPDNPMINAGAIATTALVQGRTARQKICRILDGIGRYAGRPLHIDHSVYHSESQSGDRNRAIAYMLRNFNIIDSDPIPSLDAYFMQCSIAVTCRDLGIMAATLANAGVNPVTGARAIIREHVQSVLSVMGSCGMYDAAGEWIYQVGMPAKSGVSGGILAVLPGQLGIGVFSPRLDERGNSVRGVKFCREISTQFDLHMFNAPQISTSVLRKRTFIGEVFSNRLRSESDRAILKRFGKSAEVLLIQGAVMFAPVEVVIREVIRREKSLQGVIIDFAHVQAVDFVTCRLLAGLVKGLIRSRKFVSISRAKHLPVLTRVFRKRGVRATFFEDLDLALEDGENRVLTRFGKGRRRSRRARLDECDAVRGMSRKDLGILKRLLVRKSFPRGEIVIRAGDIPGEMYILIAGTASVSVSQDGMPRKRIATFSPGMMFGDMALLARLPRSADVTADSDIEVLALSAEQFDSLATLHPSLQTLLLRNISLALARRVREANSGLLGF